MFRARVLPVAQVSPLPRPWLGVEVEAMFWLMICEAWDYWDTQSVNATVGNRRYGWWYYDWVWRWKR